MKKENPHHGSSVDAFFEEMGELDEIKTRLAKAEIVEQLTAAMTRRNVSKSALARAMRTAPVAVDRLLDPKRGGVTLKSIVAAARALNMRLDVKLTPIEEHTQTAKRRKAG